jgi:hypothetical protein
MSGSSAKPEVLPHNGAAIIFDPQLHKHAVIDSHGVLHGYRHDAAAAREFAASLPGEPDKEPEPAPIPRSPRAVPQPEVQYLPAGIPRDERRDFPEVRAPRVITPYERSRALSRRQDAAFMQVYGKHLVRR